MKHIKKLNKPSTEKAKKITESKEARRLLTPNGVKSLGCGHVSVGT